MDIAFVFECSRDRIHRSCWSRLNTQHLVVVDGQINPLLLLRLWFLLVFFTGFTQGRSPAESVCSGIIIDAAEIVIGQNLESILLNWVGLLESSVRIDEFYLGSVVGNTEILVVIEGVVEPTGVFGFGGNGGL